MDNRPPTCEAVVIEKLLPNRENVRSEIELPAVAKSKTDNAEPNFTIDLNDTELPNAAKERMESCFPRHPRVLIENAEPSIVASRTEND